jgi:ubiquitin-protein ligase
MASINNKSALKKGPIVKKNTRVDKEMQKNKLNKDFEFAVNPNDDKKWYFLFTVEDGDYAGQKHIVEMNMIPTYPFSPPKCKFLTPILHSNIAFKSGEICVDTLKHEWSPAQSTQSIISILKILLNNPNPSSALNSNARPPKKPTMKKPTPSMFDEPHKMIDYGRLYTKQSEDYIKALDELKKQKNDTYDMCKVHIEVRNLFNL